MANFPELDTFQAKIGPTEQILRGGCLREPTLLTNLDFTLGRQFFNVSRFKNTMRMFLTGDRSGNPFLQNRLMSFVARLRDQKQGELSEGAPPKSIPGDAVLDSLGSEASSSSTPQTPNASRLSAERRRALMTQFQIVTVEFPFGGEKWQCASKRWRPRSRPPVSKQHRPTSEHCSVGSAKKQPSNWNMSPRPSRRLSTGHRPTPTGDDIFARVVDVST